MTTLPSGTPNAGMKVIVSLKILDFFSSLSSFEFCD